MIFIRHHLLHRPLPVNTQQISVPRLRFKPTILAGVRPQIGKE